MLNKEQQEAYDGIVEAFSTDTPTIAVLTGAAGTGKTFLTKKLADKLNPVLCAMTHKAAAVMATKTERNVLTLAKVLKQKKYNDLDTGEVKFKTPTNVKLNKKVLFIDEASMCNKDNYKQVLETIGNNYHILFIGDKFQLPPVNEDYALPFEADYTHFTLTQPMRFKQNSGIDRTSLTVRTALQENRLKMEGMREILKECDDVSWLRASEAVPMMVEDFKNAEQPDDVRVISFTNKIVDSYNYHLKKEVTGDPEHIKEGDLLVANEAISELKLIEGVMKDIVIIRNNETVKVKEVVEREHLGHLCYFITTTFGLKVRVPIYRNEIEYEIAKLRSTALSFSSGSMERKRAFAEMFQFKDSFHDLRVGYAQTVHKAQGSTFKTVYFDLNSLNSDTIIGKKLLYTGVTRAAEKLVLFK